MGATAAALVPAAPFARSGARVRSGYDLTRTVASVGLVDGRAARVAVVALAVLPLLAAGAFVAASLRRPRAVATLAVMAGTVTTLAGAVVLRAPLSAEVGAPVAVAVGLATIGVGALAATRR